MASHMYKRDQNKVSKLNFDNEIEFFFDLKKLLAEILNQKFFSESLSVVNQFKRFRKNSNF